MKEFFRNLAYQYSLLGYFRQTWRKFYNTPGNIDRQALLAQHQFVQSLLDQPRHADPKRLNRFEHQVFSQNGEDGIIAEIFRRVGTSGKTFVEIGVGDGLENNTTCLLAQGWSGVWIDGDARAAAKVRKTFWQPLAQGRLRLHVALVTAENVAGLLEGLRVPAEFDLLSLDIDRNTWFAWEALRKFRPRVAVIEYNSSWPADVDWKVEYDPKLVYNTTMYFGASLKALETLGRRLGYSLVGCDLGGVNAFFVRDDLVGDNFCAPFTAENHYEPPRYFLIRRDGHPRCFTDMKPA